ncbi:MAG: ParB/RepB/Spo0J family partition protein [Actinomycetota bacterium]
MEELATSAIVPNPRQPRRRFDDDAIADLAASITQVGMLQPVVVRRLGMSTYELVVGERRWRAARRAGLATIPALIVETDEQGSLERALVENLHRENLTAIEEAAGYQQLIEEAAFTHEQLAERLGFSRPTVTNALRLLELPASIQRLILDRRLSAGHGRALLGMGKHPLLERVALRVAGEGLSVRETEDLVRQYRVENPPKDPDPLPETFTSPRPALPGIDELSATLAEGLQTRVRITRGKKKGKMVIEFGSFDELYRIAHRILPQPPAEAGAARE